MFFNTRAAKVAAVVTELFVFGGALALRFTVDNTDGLADGLTAATAIWGTILNACFSSGIDACARRCDPQPDRAYQQIQP